MPVGLIEERSDLACVAAGLMIIKMVGFIWKE
jgi:hypothetical protein